MKKTTIGNCTLYHGDSFDILPKLDAVADAVISDPPFGITACDWDTVPLPVETDSEFRPFRLWQVCR